MKKIVLFAAAALLAGPALAASDNPAFRSSEQRLDLTLHHDNTQQLNDIFGTYPRPPIAIIARDAVYGALAGAVIGTGVGLINGYDLGRDIAIGAGIGIVAGAVIGALDVASRDRYMDRSEGTPAFVAAPKASYGARF
jgi:hypothetical protein